mmetsp:Transcript_40660/g.80093  ORF Transcript_40660/g.80093 Transcript_40660/m.80093 type:complete len:122 (+) Transcript_40660:1772-2137(+)
MRSTRTASPTRTTKYYNNRLKLCPLCRFALCSHGPRAKQIGNVDKTTGGGGGGCDDDVDDEHDDAGDLQSGNVGGGERSRRGVTQLQRWRRGLILGSHLKAASKVQLSTQQRLTPLDGSIL